MFIKNCKIVLASFIIFLCSACAVGPDYVKPQIETPDTFEALNNPDFVAEKFDTAWWGYFDDELLVKLIEDAVAENKDVKQALSRVNQARAMLSEATAKLLPSTSSSFIGQKINEYGHSRIKGMPVTSYDTYNASLDASWEIDIFGKLRRNREAQSALVDASVANMYDAVRILVTDIANTYFSLRSYQEQLEIAKRNIKAQEETLDIVTAKFNAGQVSELDKVRAETQLEATKSIMPPLESGIKVSMHRLAVLSGKYPNELNDILKKSKPMKLFNGPVSITDAESLLKSRPDILVAERNLAANTALIGFNKADYFPRVTIGGSFSLSSDDLSRVFHNGSKLAAGPSISWTPFDFGQIRARVKASEEKVNEALSNYEGTILRAFEDVENSLTRFSSERKRYVMLQKTFELSKKSYHLAMDQYKEGVLDFISVLTAQSDMLNNENNVCQSKEKLNESVVSIYKALGGGWESWQLVKN